MREVKKCEWCGEQFVTYQKSCTCSQDCYKKNRKKKGWFRKDFKKKVNCMSESRNKVRVGGTVPKGFE